MAKWQPLNLRQFQLLSPTEQETYLLQLRDWRAHRADVATRWHQKVEQRKAENVQAGDALWAKLHPKSSTQSASQASSAEAQIPAIPGFGIAPAEIARRKAQGIRPAPQSASSYNIKTDPRYAAYTAARGKRNKAVEDAVRATQFPSYPSGLTPEDEQKIARRQRIARDQRALADMRAEQQKRVLEQKYPHRRYTNQYTPLRYTSRAQAEASIAHDLQVQDRLQGIQEARRQNLPTHIPGTQQRRTMQAEQRFRQLQRDIEYARTNVARAEHEVGLGGTPATLQRLRMMQGRYQRLYDLGRMDPLLQSGEMQNRMDALFDPDVLRGGNLQLAALERGAYASPAVQRPTLPTPSFSGPALGQAPTGSQAQWMLTMLKMRRAAIAGVDPLVAMMREAPELSNMLLNHSMGGFITLLEQELGPRISASTLKSRYGENWPNQFVKEHASEASSSGYSTQALEGLARTYRTVAESYAPGNSALGSKATQDELRKFFKIRTNQSDADAESSESAQASTKELKGDMLGIDQQIRMTEEAIRTGHLGNLTNIDQVQTSKYRRGNVFGVSPELRKAMDEIPSQVRTGQILDATDYEKEMPNRPDMEAHRAGAEDYQHQIEILAAVTGRLADYRQSPALTRMVEQLQPDQRKRFMQNWHQLERIQGNLERRGFSTDRTLEGTSLPRYGRRHNQTRYDPTVLEQLNRRYQRLRGFVGQLEELGQGAFPERSQLADLYLQQFRTESEGHPKYSIFHPGYDPVTNRRLSGPQGDLADSQYLTQHPASFSVPEMRRIYSMGRIGAIFSNYLFQGLGFRHRGGQISSPTAIAPAPIPIPRGISFREQNEQGYNLVGGLGASDAAGVPQGFSDLRNLGHRGQLTAQYYNRHALAYAKTRFADTETLEQALRNERGELHGYMSYLIREHPRFLQLYASSDSRVQKAHQWYERALEDARHHQRNTTEASDPLFDIASRAQEARLSPEQRSQLLQETEQMAAEQRTRMNEHLSPQELYQKLWGDVGARKVGNFDEIDAKEAAQGGALLPADRSRIARAKSSENIALREAMKYLLRQAQGQVLASNSDLPGIQETIHNLYNPHDLALHDSMTLNPYQRLALSEQQPMLAKVLSQLANVQPGEDLSLEEVGEALAGPRRAHDEYNFYAKSGLANELELDPFQQNMRYARRMFDTMRGGLLQDIGSNFNDEEGMGVSLHGYAARLITTIKNRLRADVKAGRVRGSPNLYEYTAEQPEFDTLGQLWRIHSWLYGNDSRIQRGRTIQTLSALGEALGATRFRPQKANGDWTQYNSFWRGLGAPIATAFSRGKNTVADVLGRQQALSHITDEFFRTGYLTRRNARNLLVSGLGHTQENASRILNSEHSVFKNSPGVHWSMLPGFDRLAQQAYQPGQVVTVRRGRRMQRVMLAPLVPWSERGKLAGSLAHPTAWQGNVTFKGLSGMEELWKSKFAPQYYGILRKMGIPASEIARSAGELKRLQRAGGIPGNIPHGLPFYALPINPYGKVSSNPFLAYTGEIQTEGTPVPSHYLPEINYATNAFGDLALHFGETPQLPAPARTLGDHVALPSPALQQLPTPLSVAERKELAVLLAQGYDPSVEQGFAIYRRPGEALQLLNATKRASAAGLEWISRHELGTPEGSEFAGYVHTHPLFAKDGRIMGIGRLSSQDLRDATMKQGNPMYAYERGLGRLGGVLQYGDLTPEQEAFIKENAAANGINYSGAIDMPRNALGEWTIPQGNLHPAQLADLQEDFYRRELAFATGALAPIQSATGDISGEALKALQTPLWQKLATPEMLAGNQGQYANILKSAQAFAGEELTHPDVRAAVPDFGTDSLLQQILISPQQGIAAVKQALKNADTVDEQRALMDQLGPYLAASQEGMRYLRQSPHGRRWLSSQASATPPSPPPSSAPLPAGVAPQDFEDPTLTPFDRLAMKGANIQPVLDQIREHNRFALLAGPGVGKTTIMAHQYLRSLMEDETRNGHIRILTGNNQAALAFNTHLKNLAESVGYHMPGNTKPAQTVHKFARYALFYSQNRGVTALQRMLQQEEGLTPEQAAKAAPKRFGHIVQEAPDFDVKQFRPGYSLWEDNEALGSREWLLAAQLHRMGVHVAGFSEGAPQDNQFRISLRELGQMSKSVEGFYQLPHEEQLEALQRGRASLGKLKLSNGMLPITAGGIGDEGLFALYHTMKRGMGMVDWHDVIRGAGFAIHNAAGSLLTRPDKVLPYQSMFDEFNDADESSKQLAKNLAEAGSQLIIAGDPNQTIFTGHPQGFLDVLRGFLGIPSTAMHTPNQQFRARNMGQLSGYNATMAAVDALSGLRTPQMVPGRGQEWNSGGFRFNHSARNQITATRQMLTGALRQIGLNPDEVIEATRNGSLHEGNWEQWFTEHSTAGIRPDQISEQVALLFQKNAHIDLARQQAKAMGLPSWLFFKRNAKNLKEAGLSALSKLHMGTIHSVKGGEFEHVFGQVGEGTGGWGLWSDDALKQAQLINVLASRGAHSTTFFTPEQMLTSRQIFDVRHGGKFHIGDNDTLSMEGFGGQLKEVPRHSGQSRWQGIADFIAHAHAASGQSPRAVYQALRSSGVLQHASPQVRQMVESLGRVPNTATSSAASSTGTNVGATTVTAQTVNIAAQTANVASAQGAATTAAATQAAQQGGGAIPGALRNQFATAAPPPPANAAAATAMAPGQYAGTPYGPMSPPPAGTTGSPGGYGGSNGGGGGPTRQNNWMSNFGRTMARITWEVSYYAQNMLQNAQNELQVSDQYRIPRSQLNILAGQPITPQNISPVETLGASWKSAPFQSAFRNFSAAQLASAEVGYASTFGVRGKAASRGMLENLKNPNQFFRQILAASTIGNISPEDLMYYLGQASQGTQQAFGGNATAAGQNALASMFQMGGGVLNSSNISPIAQSYGQIAPLQTYLNQNPASAQSLLNLAASQGTGALPLNTQAISNLYSASISPDVGQQYGLLAAFSGMGPAWRNQINGYSAAVAQGKNIDITPLVGSMAESIAKTGLQLPDLAGELQTFLQKQGQIIQLQTSVANNIPGLEISSIYAQIGADQASLGAQATNLAYGRANYAFNLNQQNQLYGPIGKDVSRTAYFDFLKSSAAAGYDFTNVNQAGRYAPVQTFGLKNAEFYAGVENQRQQMVLGRSKLTSDLAFQQQMKYLNEQENFYKQDLKIQNDERAFQKKWQAKLLDAQAAQLGAQERLVHIQEALAAAQIPVLQWEQKMDPVMLKLQEEQLAALLQKTVGGGPGPMGRNLAPIDVLKNISTTYSQYSGNDLNQALMPMVGYDPSQASALANMVEEWRKNPAAAQHFLSGNKELQQILNNAQGMTGADANAGQVYGAGQQNAVLGASANPTDLGGLLEHMQALNIAAQDVNITVGGKLKAWTGPGGQLLSDLTVPAMGGSSILNLLGYILGPAAGAGLGAWFAGGGGVGGALSGAGSLLSWLFGPLAAGGAATVGGAGLGTLLFGTLANGLSALPTHNTPGSNGYGNTFGFLGDTFGQFFGGNGLNGFMQGLGGQNGSNLRTNLFGSGFNHWWTQSTTQSPFGTALVASNPLTMPLVGISQILAGWKGLFGGNGDNTPHPTQQSLDNSAMRQMLQDWWLKLQGYNPANNGDQVGSGNSGGIGVNARNQQTLAPQQQQVVPGISPVPSGPISGPSVTRYQNNYVNPDQPQTGRQNTWQENTGNFFSGLGSNVHSALGNIGDFFSQVGSDTQSAKKQIGGMFSGLGSDVQGGIRNVGTFFSHVGSDAQTAKKWIGGMFSGLGSDVQSGLRAVGGFFSGVGADAQNAKKWVGNIFSTLGSSVQGAEKAVGGFFSSVEGGIWTAIHNAQQIGGNIAWSFTHLDWGSMAWAIGHGLSNIMSPGWWSGIFGNIQSGLANVFRNMNLPSVGDLGYDLSLQVLNYWNKVADQIQRHFNVDWHINWRILGWRPYATGGFTKEGWSLLGEHGPELAQLPVGTHVLNHEDTLSKLAQMLSSNGSGTQKTQHTVTINVQGSGTHTLSNEDVDCVLEQAFKILTDELKH